MNLYLGKQERINGTWYTVAPVAADSIAEANKQVYVGLRRSYGTVEAVRGRWEKVRNEP